MNLSPLNRNTRATWEGYFADGWERNRGRQQTWLFARYFLDTFRLPESTRTLLDVGCAMGDALPAFHARYPALELHGCDVSSAAIDQARACYGEIATFHVWGFEEIQGCFDVIYCSNTLEHFENYLNIARQLLTHCKRLYILVPYLELGENGRPLEPADGQWHVATFDAASFDPLMREAKVSRIRHWLHPCPVAWGPARPEAPRGGVYPHPAEIFFELAVEAPSPDEASEPVPAQSPGRNLYAATVVGAPPGGSAPVVDEESVALLKWLEALGRLERDVEAVVGQEGRFILVDDDQLRGELRGALAADGRPIPFLERGGQYWGPPVDDAAAIRELERLRAVGARFLVFGWPGFWWTDHYCGFHAHLCSRFPCILESELALVFDLRRGAKRTDGRARSDPGAAEE